MSNITDLLHMKRKADILLPQIYKQCLSKCDDNLVKLMPQKRICHPGVCCTLDDGCFWTKILDTCNARFMEKKYTVTKQDESAMNSAGIIRGTIYR